MKQSKTFREPTVTGRKPGLKATNDLEQKEEINIQLEQTASWQFIHL